MNRILPVALALLPAAADAADWPRFRGPTGDGIAEETAAPPVAWSDSNNIAWKTAVPGRGRSSPVVLGDRIFLTTAVERGVLRKRIGSDDMQIAEHVAIGAVCVDRETGTIRWHVTLREIDHPDPVHWLSSWATPTPVAGPGRVYCDFGTFGTWCLDAETGKTVWTERNPQDHQVGPGSSPLLAGDRLLFICDARDAQYVMARDPKTGAVLWKTDRPPIEARHVNCRKSFSSPIAIRVGGKPQVAAVGPHWVVGLAPDTGTEIWRVRHGMGFSIGTVPVHGHGLLFIGTGCFKPDLVAIRTDGTGDVTESHIAWRERKGVPRMSSPILVDDAIYWVSDDGMVTCAEAKTGITRWQERLGGSHLASPVLAAGRLYFWAKEGKTAVLKPGKTFDKLAENTLEGLVTGTPAVVDRAIFLRTDTHLYRIEMK